MLLLRRFLVVAALMFWQGGFTFYAAVVVPIAQERLGHVGQGFITQNVTNYMNFAGAVTLGLLAWDAAVSGDRHRLRRWGRWASWVAMAVLLGVLVWLHVVMDAHMDVEAGALRSGQEFRPIHRKYLWVSTAQWGFGIAYILLMLQAWRLDDRDTR
jgi:hypothetical protein